MPQPATPAATTPPLDPLVAMINDSFNKILPPKDAPANPNPEPIEQPTPKPKTTMTLGERVALNAEAAKQTQPAAPAAPSDPTPATPPAPAEAPKPPKVTVKKPEPTFTPQVTPAVTPQAAAPTAPPVQPPEDPNKEFVAGLSDVEREEYEIAQYAEAHFGQKGKAANTLDYFKKVQAFSAANPDATPDSDEFQDFIKKNAPKYSPGERRKIERKMIEDSAEARARAAVSPELEKLRQEQHALKSQPKIDAAVQDFKLSISKNLEIPETVNPIFKEVALSVLDKGYAKASKDFPIEAPIVATGIATAEEYSRLSHSVVPFDPKNETHRWLENFVGDQGKKFAAQPAENKTFNGRTFLPLHEYAEARRKNPDEARAKFWTFSNQQIMDMIAMNTALEVDAAVKKLEAAGFKRDKKSDKPQTQPPPTPASPRAGATAAPGAAVTTPPVNPNANFIDALVPGASKRINL